MTKQMTITVDLEKARKMLSLAGYKDVRKMNDEEIFSLALHMSEKYGVEAYIVNSSNELLFRRLDEIDGELQEWRISADKSDLLTKEKEVIQEELSRRGLGANNEHRMVR